MNTTAAPANTWEVRMRWGDRALEAEVIDGRGRKALALGERETDDFVIGDGARLDLTWLERGLEVKFSLGVAGTASLKGAEPVALGQLVERGVVKDLGGGGYVITLGANDSLALQVAGQHIDVRQAKARVARLSIDALATVALISALALLGAWIASTLMGMTPLNLMPKDPPKQLGR